MVIPVAGSAAAAMSGTIRAEPGTRDWYDGLAKAADRPPPLPPWPGASPRRPPEQSEALVHDHAVSRQFRPLLNPPGAGRSAVPPTPTTYGEEAGKSTPWVLPRPRSPGQS